MEWYKEYKKFVESAIDYYIDKNFSEDESKALNEFSEIVRYSMSWWKKIRWIMLLEAYFIETWESLRDLSFEDDIVKVAFAIEALHSYSLVHDDLPCMDNDEMRRGQETVWKKYWEYKSVLAWDMLQTLAFDVLSSLSDSKRALGVISVLSKAIWFNWMMWGQILDLYYEREEDSSDISQIVRLHNYKTWALIKSSLVVWSILWLGLYKEHFESFWESLGLAFQIKDDLLDVEWTLEETWKSVWGEEKGFVHYLWEEETRSQLNHYLNISKVEAEKLGSDKLLDLVRYVGERRG